MKKTYKSPTVKVVKTKMQRILAGSAKGIGLKGRASKNYETLGRGAEFSDWDEE